MGIINIVMAVLEELVQVSLPLAAKNARNLKENFFIIENIAIECMIVLNISVVLT